MKLITEHSEDLKYISEAAENGEKKFIIDGIFMQAEQVNRNRRIYPKKVLESAVNKYVADYVNKGRAVGELNHPDGPTINLDKVSHRITELQWNGNDVVGKALILDTPMGKIVKGLLEGGCQLGVSSRGMGTVANRNGQTFVNDDFVLSTVDIVQDPSAPSAFVNGIMEGVEWIWDNGLLKAQQLENYETEIKKASSVQLAETQMRVWSDFLSKL
jgi:hypothetical protein